MQKNTKCDITKEKASYYGLRSYIIYVSTCKSEMWIVPIIILHVRWSEIFDSDFCEKRYSSSNLRRCSNSISPLDPLFFALYFWYGRLLRDKPCYFFSSWNYGRLRALFNEVYGFDSFTYYCAGTSRIRRISRGLIDSVVQRFARKKAHPSIDISTDIVLSNILYSKERWQFWCKKKRFELQIL